MKNEAWLGRMLCVFAMTAGLGGTAFAQMGESPSPQAPQPPHEQAPPSAQRPGSPTMSDPGDTLEMARQSMQANDTSEAANQMRQAAAAIRADVAMAPRQARGKLQDAAKKLDRTAQQLASGQSVSPQAADTTLAEAATALAKYNHEVARDALRSKDKQRFSRHLEASAHDLDRAAKWSGREGERGVRDAVGDAVELSGKVTEGAGAIPEDAGRVVDELGRGIDRVGKDIHGAKPAK